MAQNTTREESNVWEIDIQYLIVSSLNVLKNIWWLVVLLMIIGSILVPIVQYKSYVPKYESYCSFSVKVINKAATSEVNSLYGFYYDKDLAEQMDKTFTYILESDYLADEIKERLGPVTLGSNLKLECIEGSNLFVLKVYGDTPEKSMDLLQAVMDVYSDAARYVIGELQIDMVEEPIMSEKPYNAPSLMKNILIGSGLGLVIGIIYAVLKGLLNRTVKNPEDLEDRVNMPCLGLVPIVEMRHRRRREGSSPVSKTHSDGEFRENIRGIARKIEDSLKEKTSKIVLVTSTMPNEGKTMFSQNLAEALSDWNNKVLLIDGDLRNPVLYKYFGIRNRKMPLEKALYGEVDIDSVTSYIDNLCFIGNTEVVEAPTVLINSHEMEQFIKYQSEQFDYVIIDAPPCDTMSDVSLYQEYVDEVVYMVRQDFVSISKIIETVDNLCESSNKLIGYVLNGVEKTARGYGKYGYGRYSYGRYGGGYYNRYNYSRYSDD